MAPLPTPAVTSDLAPIDRNEELEALVGTEDNNDGGDGRSTIDDEGDGGDQPRQRRTEERHLPPGEAKRNAIIDRFRRDGTRPFDGDMTRAENIYGEVADEHLAPEADADEPGVPKKTEELQPQQRVHQIVVRGKTVEMTDDQLLAHARKVEAADSYLEESRKILEEAKAVRSERSSQDHRPHDDQTDAQNDGQDSRQPDQQGRPHGPDYKAIVEKIQFGDPDEAARALAEVIDQQSTAAATKAANEGHVNRLIANDLKRSQDDLKAFRAANQALAGDAIAEDVIGNQVIKIYREEIEALGMDPSQIPTDPKQLSDWHRFYRVNGHNVSKTSDILNKAKDRFESWRGGAPTNREAAPRQEAPRVTVNVDRTERRQAIPQQPTRAAVPRRNETPPPTVEQSRKSAFQEMRKARGQTTG